MPIALAQTTPAVDSLMACRQMGFNAAGNHSKSDNSMMHYCFNYIATYILFIAI